jgi:hypothetical protein
MVQPAYKILCPNIRAARRLRSDEESSSVPQHASTGVGINKGYLPLVIYPGLKLVRLTNVLPW